MRYTTIALAVLAGSALSTANAQFSSSTPAVSKAASSVVAAPSGGGGLLNGGGDHCSAPDAIFGTGSFFFDNSTATTGTEGQNESICYEFGTTAVINDVWFCWRADFTGIAQADTCGSPTDTKIAAYPNPGCPPDGTALDCNDDECGWQSVIRFPVVDGQPYRIQVGLYPYASGGTGMLNIAPVPTANCPVMHDGVSETSVGLTAGGDTCFMYYVDCMTRIDTIEVAYGTPIYPGSIANGSPVTLAIWDDPTNDEDPNDAVLITTIPVPAGVTNADTDILNVYATGGVVVNGGTWVGAVVTQLPGEYPCCEDSSNTSFNRNWVAGATLTTGLSFDFNTLTNNDVPPLEVSSIGLDGAWLLQVNGTPSGPDNPGIGYCFGDGSGTPCPCGNNNDGSLPGAGCANGAHASGALLTGSGLASVSNDTVVLTTTGLDPNNTGLYFQADNSVNGGQGNVFGDGLRCAGGGLVRLQIRTSDLSGTSSTTVALGALGGVGPGDVKRYQCWYRDTSGAQPCGVGVNDFNLSNGYEITWIP